MIRTLSTVHFLSDHRNNRQVSGHRGSSACGEERLAWYVLTFKIGVFAFDLFFCRERDPGRDMQISNLYFFEKFITSVYVPLQKSGRSGHGACAQGVGR